MVIEKERNVFSIRFKMLIFLSSWRLSSSFLSHVGTWRESMRGVQHIDVDRAEPFEIRDTTRRWNSADAFAVDLSPVRWTSVRSARRSRRFPDDSPRRNRGPEKSLAESHAGSRTAVRARVHSRRNDRRSSQQNPAGRHSSERFVDDENEKDDTANGDQRRQKREIRINRFLQNLLHSIS